VQRLKAAEHNAITWRFCQEPSIADSPEAVSEAVELVELIEPADPISDAQPA